MGTRNLTCVIMDGKYGVAQYGQWDGYPSSSGVTIYEFLKTIEKDGTIEEFKNKISRCRFISEDEQRNLWIGCGATPGSTSVGMDVAEKFKARYSSLSRDTGANILNLIHTSPEPVLLTNSIEFANEGLMCEWVYVLDLDTLRLKVYRGQYNEPHLASERFPGQVLLWDCAFADLPSKPEMFVMHLDALADRSRRTKKKVAK